MKFKCTITEEVLRATEKCGNDDGIAVSENCLFAYIYNQLVQNVSISNYAVNFLDRDNKRIAFKEVNLFHYLNDEISLFDQQPSIEQRRVNFLGKEYEIEIPDEVIEYWHPDPVVAVQNLINNSILQPIN